ncbi:RNA 2',3'-cyclic phosphodiesterase [candidate division WOR-3 bacterium]|nr:RNA 2',3'-cyclic phosphodiesterase [candidate division WOR-3 bacterium]
MRAFLAIEVPASARLLIHDLIENESRKDLPVKWVAFENLHITLKFLGEIDERKKAKITPSITAACHRHKPFTVVLGGLGCFPGPRNPRVLWVGMKQGGSAVCALAADLDEELTRFGFEKEGRFHPHLTIGRVKQPCSVDSTIAQEIQTDAFEVCSVVLFRSTLKPTGPIYDELERFAL